MNVLAAKYLMIKYLFLFFFIFYFPLNAKLIETKNSNALCSNGEQDLIWNWINGSGTTKYINND